MADNSDDYGELIDRRRFIELTGAGAAALAGCGGGDGATATETSSPTDADGGGTTPEPDTATPTPGEPFYSDVAHLSNTNQAPSDIQWNQFNPSGFSQISHEILFEKFARYNFAEGKFKKEGLESWNLSGKEFRMTITEGLTWENGDPVTAEDVALQLKLAKRTGAAFGDFTDSVTTDGERTVVVKLAETVNPDIVKFQILANYWIQTPKSVFQKYLDNYDSMSEDKATSKLTSFSWTNPVANGPFAVNQKSGSQLSTNHREDYPRSDNINFGHYNFRFIDGNQATQQALLNLDIDSVFTLAAKARVVAQFPDAVDQVRTPSLWGYGLVPNHDRKHTGDRAVRQAIAYVINRKVAVNNSLPLAKKAPKYCVGINNSNQERVLGDRASDFRTYGRDKRMTKKATSVLQNAGYSKSNGTWQDPDGNPVTLPVIVPSGWTDWEALTETVVDHLSSFGFDATMETRPFGTLLDNTWPNGKFKISAGGWNAGAPQGALPYFTLRHQLIQNFRGFTYNYDPASKERGGSLSDVTVPKIGGGGEMTVNPSKRIKKLARTTDSQKAREIVLEQAWVTNVDLPMIPIAEKQEQSFLTHDDWDIPRPPGQASAPKTRWPNVYLPRVGKMNYKG